MAETKLGQDAVTLPVGTTAQRPSNPEPGMIRFNTDEGYVEWYDNVGDRWLATSFFPGVVATGGTVTDISQDGQVFRVHTFTSDDTFDVVRGGEVEYLIVAGGGGGAGRYGGGGGAGGVLQGTENVEVDSYSITVGVGGSGGAQTPGECCDTTRSGNRGNNSSVFGFTAIGGGGGVSNNAAAQNNHNGEEDGGSGGGGARAVEPGTGTAGQGNDGGDQFSDDLNFGGGGGAGSPGENATVTNTGNGGDGIESTITGETKFYGGGGAGGSHNPHPDRFGKGGLGGGADAREPGGPVYTGFDGQANTGGGGGSAVRDGSNSNTGPGGNGGSGIVIVRYRVG